MSLSFSLACFASLCGTILFSDQAAKVSKVADTGWTITGVILDHHVNAPARQEMLLAGVRAMLQRAGVPAPPDLSRRFSAVSNEEQWKALLAELWPNGDSAAPQALEEAFQAALLRAIPGHAQVVTAAERKAIEGFAGNRYVGTGVQIGYDPREKLAFIISPIRNGPAHRAGGRPGDRIVEIDGKDTHDIGLKAVVEMLRGDEGSKVTVVVRQPQSDEKRTLEITRGVSPIETVLGYGRADGERWRFRPDPELPIGYLAVTSLSSSTLHELKSMEGPLQADGIRGLVLDLRFAHGASAHHAALFADGLLDGALIWRARDARQNTREHRADRDCLFRDWPIVILIDQNAGSSPAWLAGTLQDAGRAVVVGQTIVRDGYTRSFVDLPGGRHAIELATGLVERAKQSTGEPGAGEDFEREVRQGWLIRPDHVLPTTPQQRAVLQQWTFDKTTTEPPQTRSPEPPTDKQLAKAISVLKSTVKSKDVEQKNESDGER
jgi:C-terminal peptidase prc